MDVGLVLIRAVVGLLFVGHGTQKLFGLFGGPGLQGTARFLGSLGYRRSRAMAVVHGVAEAVGGLLFALGLLTPVAAALIGVMLNAAIVVHARNGLWNQDGGFELPLVLAAAALGVAFVGPGAWSLDAALGLETLFGWTLAGVSGGLGALVLGLIVGGAVLATRRPQVAVEEGAAEQAA